MSGGILGLADVRVATVLSVAAEEGRRVYCVESEVIGESRSTWSSGVVRRGEKRRGGRSSQCVGPFRRPAFLLPWPSARRALYSVSPVPRLSDMQILADTAAPPRSALVLVLETTK